MSEKTFIIKDGDLSDGYHTFDELYEHRHALFLQLIRNLRGNEAANGTLVYKISEHFEGWDLLVYNNLLAGQISYHIPARLRPYYDWVKEKPLSEHDYDGHTSKDVIVRLLGLHHDSEKGEG